MNRNKKTERKTKAQNMSWPFQKRAAPQSPSAVCSKLGALQDAECEELLRQTEQYEAQRFLKDRKIQVRQSSVPILPKPPNSPGSSYKVSISLPWCRIV